MIHGVSSSWPVNIFISALVSPPPGRVPPFVETLRGLGGRPASLRQSTELSRDGGQSFSEVLGDVPSTTRIYDWTVTGPPTPEAKVRVSSLADPVLSDTSYSTFTIISPIPTVRIIGTVFDPPFDLDMAVPGETAPLRVQVDHGTGMAGQPVTVAIQRLTPVPSCTITSPVGGEPEAEQTQVINSTQSGAGTLTFVFDVAVTAASCDSSVTYQAVVSAATGVTLLPPVQDHAVLGIVQPTLQIVSTSFDAATAVPGQPVRLTVQVHHSGGVHGPVEVRVFRSDQTACVVTTPSDTTQQQPVDVRGSGELFFDFTIMVDQASCDGSFTYTAEVVSMPDTVFLRVPDDPLNDGTASCEILRSIYIETVEFVPASRLPGEASTLKVTVRSDPDVPTGTSITVRVHLMSTQPSSSCPVVVSLPVPELTKALTPGPFALTEYDFPATVDPGSCAGSVTYRATITTPSTEAFTVSQTPKDATLTVSQAPPNIAPERLKIATGGTNPSDDDIMISPDNAGIQETFVANYGGQGQMASLDFNPTTGVTRAVSAAPQDSSALWRLRAIINGQVSANGTEVIVPPQNLIQVLIGEDATDLIQGNLRPSQAVGIVIRNRVNDSRWPGTYNEVITQPLQFASTTTTRYLNARMRSTTTNLTAYDNALKVATDVYGLVPPLNLVTLGKAIAFGSPGAIKEPNRTRDINTLLLIANTTPCPAVYKVNAKTLGFDIRWFPTFRTIDEQVVLINEIPVATFAFIRERPPGGCAVIKAGFFDNKF